jgi:outer membrane protein OmpA-like peptidoglycan-associated protein
MKVSIPADIYFGAGSDVLKYDAGKSLDNFARILKARYSGQPIRIEGYSDTSPIKSNPPKDMKKLSQLRADAVKRALITRGVPAQDMIAIGLGSVKPMKTRMLSRRVEITVGTP